MEQRMRTKGVRPNVVTGEIVHLRKFATVDRTNIKEVLPAFPHWIYHGFQVS